MDPTGLASSNLVAIYTSPAFWITYLTITVLLLAALWRIFAKAGQPGWAAIVPIYNAYIILKVAGRPGWWLVLYFIPFVNLVVWLIVQYDMAKAFGKGLGFAIGLWLLPGIFHMILGFGGAQYARPSAA
jgi:hypothetical protein